MLFLRSIFKSKGHDFRGSFFGHGNRGRGCYIVRTIPYSTIHAEYGHVFLGSKYSIYCCIFSSNFLFVVGLEVDTKIEISGFCICYNFLLCFVVHCKSIFRNKESFRTGFPQEL